MPGLEPHRFLEVLDRFVQFPLISEGGRQVVVGLEVVRPQAERRREACHSVVQAPERQVGGAEVVLRLGVGLA